MHCVQDDSFQQPDEETALLASPERKVSKAPTPLPRLQIFILLLMQLAEPITSNCIYPFINQVSLLVMSLLTIAHYLVTSSSASSTLRVVMRKKSATTQG